MEEPQLGSARGSSSFHHSCRLDILSTALSLWGHEEAFGDRWNVGKAYMAQVKPLCMLTEQSSELLFMSCGFAGGC